MFKYHRWSLNPDTIPINNTPSSRRPQILRVTVITEDNNYTNTTEFRRMFLGKPCSCCGSPSHSLMRRIPSMGTRSGQKKYEYTCSVVRYVKPYHPQASGNIRLIYVLDAKRFAKSCKYNLSLALIRLPMHYSKYEARGFLDQFFNEVRLACLEHYQEQVNPDYERGLITPRR